MIAKFKNNQWPVVVTSLFTTFALVTATLAQTNQNSELLKQTDNVGAINAQDDQRVAKISLQTGETNISMAKVKIKHQAPLGGKILVNLAGSKGTRYLQANIVLEGDSPTLDKIVKENDAALRDTAADLLSAKSVSDLDKSDARNVIRAELVSAFNRVLGSGSIRQIYLTEFAVQ